MDISINTPALLFPAISLVMLAYTNRFIGISSVVRNLHEKYAKDREGNPLLPEQIRNLRFRLKLIRRMQFLGVLSFILAIICMYMIYLENLSWAHYSFAASLISFTSSLLVSLLEIQQSNKALELELSDMEDSEKAGVGDYLKKKFGG